MLTAKQKQIYDYIAETIAKKGFPPSVREICQAVHLKSPSTVQLHLNTLEAAGYIQREAGKTRAISLTGAAPVPGKVPILGTVTAGAPILAVENIQGMLPFDMGEGQEHFALQIRGDSMVGAGILDGDLVVVRRSSTAENGSIVVALLGEEATCKRLHREKGHVWLLPENDAYAPIDGDEAELLGCVEAVVRLYR